MELAALSASESVISSVDPRLLTLPNIEPNIIQSDMFKLDPLTPIDLPESHFPRAEFLVEQNSDDGSGAELDEFFDVLFAD
jgi:hypothetical protein